MDKLGPAVTTAPPEAFVVKAYESDSIEEVDSLIKQTIHCVCLSGRLLTIQVVQGKYGKKRYAVKCVLENLKKNLRKKPSSLTKE